MPTGAKRKSKLAKEEPTASAAPGSATSHNSGTDAVELNCMLEVTGTHPRWVVARISRDLKAAWPGWSTRRVRGTVNGFAFRTALFPAAGGHVLVVNRRMQAGAGAAAGSRVRILLEPEMEVRREAIPAELAASLRGDRALKVWFEQLSPSL
ncbi:MAG TPA: DUF1905 domain-containing protein, partial [Candidatus Sulfopaludibacter sp.]|nr:DUF1905 domain-containing protein [Candidatus Sulfopaludibacter sp.]